MYFHSQRKRAREMWWLYLNFISSKLSKPRSLFLIIVLRLIKNKQIMTEQHVKANSSWTFHNRLKNILEKLGVQNCPEAVMEYLQK